MTPFRVTITMPDWCPAGASGDSTPTTTPASVADAPQPIVAALPDLDRRRALAAARQKRRRDRLASRTPSVTMRDKPRDKRDGSVTSSVTEEGGLGGDGPEVSSVERLANKAETQEKQDPKPSLSPEVAPVSRHARVTLSRSPVTHVTHPEEPMPTVPDIIAAWPETAGAFPCDRDILRGVRAVCFKYGLDDQQATAFLLERVKAYAASPYVQTNQPEYRTGWREWLAKNAIDADPPGWWAKAKAKSEVKGKATVKINMEGVDRI